MNAVVKNNTSRIILQNCFVLLDDSTCEMANRLSNRLPLSENTIPPGLCNISCLPLKICSQCTKITILDFYEQKLRVTKIKTIVTQMTFTI